MNSKWTIKSTATGYTVQAGNVDEEHYGLCHQDHSTVRWEFRNPGMETDLVVEREGNLLVARGKFKGKEVTREFKVDSLPWYQFIEVSLAAFVRSDEEKTEFWIIEPLNLKPYKMVALKQETGDLTVNGREVEAVRIKVTLPGMASLFWSSHYWYRKTDGVYLRFEGARGGPGTPKTIVELISETNS